MISFSFNRKMRRSSSAKS